MDWTKVIIPAGIMLMYLIAFISKKRKEMAEAAAQTAARERRRLEGRSTLEESAAEPGTVVVEAIPPTQTLGRSEAARRLQELAERRRVQLEELRRRAAGQSAPVSSAGRSASLPTQTQTVNQPTPRVTRTPAPRPVAPQAMPQRTPMPTRQSRPAQPARQQAPQRPTRGGQSRGTPAPVQAAPPPRRETDRPDRRSSLAESVVVPPAVTPAASAATGPRGLIPRGKGAAKDWRRIMMLKEILSPPVSLRDGPLDVI